MNAPAMEQSDTTSFCGHVEDKIHLVLISDRNYFNFVLITLTSIIHYHRSGDLIVHFVHPDLTEADFAKVDEIKSIAPFEFHPIRLDKEKFLKDFGSCHPILWRLAIPELLPGLDRIIYCDCDMVFCDDIEKLWKEDLGGKIMGACGDRVGRKISDTYPIDEVQYINSGVMVWNLKRMLEDKAELRWQQVLKEYKGNIRYTDQTLLNIVHRHDIKLLHPRWNLHNSVYRNMPIEGMYTVEETIEAIKHPGIVHFTGHHKPWIFFKFTHHPYSNRFWYFALKAPIGRCLKIKIFLKRIFTGRFHDASCKRPWNRSIICRKFD